MGQIKAIIFDLDGVLIDAKDWHYEALNKALNLFGYNINRHEHLVTFDGLPTRDKLKILTLEKGLPEGLHSFINEMKQVYTMGIIFQKCRPFFQHEYALSRLKARGLDLAVASNAVANSVQVMLEKSNLIKYFDFCLSNQDVKKAKPDPEIYHTAISKLGRKPKECLIVEDNENGLAAATASGAHVLEVASIGDVNYANIMQKIASITSEVNV